MPCIQSVFHFHRDGYICEYIRKRSFSKSLSSSLHYSLSVWPIARIVNLHREFFARRQIYFSIFNSLIPFHAFLRSPHRKSILNSVFFFPVIYTRVPHVCRSSPLLEQASPPTAHAFQPSGQPIRSSSNRSSRVDLFTFFLETRGGEMADVRYNIILELLFLFE